MINNTVYILKTYFFLLYFILFCVTYCVLFSCTPFGTYIWYLILCQVCTLLYEDKTWYENIKNNKQKYEKQYPIPMWQLLFLFLSFYQSSSPVKVTNTPYTGRSGVQEMTYKRFRSPSKKTWNGVMSNKPGSNLWHCFIKLCLQMQHFPQLFFKHNIDQFITLCIQVH